MKNLKKLISVIIAVIMLVGSFATVSAADYADVESTNSYYKAIKVLSGLGVAQGDDEGNFNPKSDVKRSEMVTFLCRAMGEEDLAPASSATNFTDVAADHWASGYITWGVNRGIINGMGDGTFAPDAAVSYQDAVVMIMRALGFDGLAMRAENGGYPTGYLKLASRYEVLKNAAYDNQAAAPREVIAQLIYNALTAPTVDFSEIGSVVDDDTYAVYEQRTLLSYVNDIYKLNAVVIDTPKAATDDTLNTDDGFKVTLDYSADTLNYYAAEALAAESADDFDVFVGETDAAELLGVKVEAYVTFDEDLNDWILLALVADAKSTVKAEITANFDTIVVDDTTDVIKYWKDLDDRKMTEFDVADITGDAVTVYYNGKAMAADAVDTGVELQAILRAASSITLAYNKTVSSVYTSIFVTDYDYAQVKSVNAAENIIKLKLGYLDLSEEARDEDFIYNIYDANGNAIGLEDIKEGDILNILTEYGVSYADSACDYVDIYVSNETVTGKVTEQKAGKWIIDGEGYAAVAGDTVDYGDEGIFFLTIDGKIFDSEAVSVISTDFAFLTGIDPDASSFETTYVLHAFTAEGHKKFDVASKVRVIVGDADGVNYYTDNTQTNKQSDIFASGGMFYDAIVNTYVDADEATAIAGIRDNYAERFFAYKLNEAGEITEIRLAGAAGSKLVLNETGSANWNADFEEFEGEAVVDVPLFVAPITYDADTDTATLDRNEITIANFSSLEEDKDYKANIYTLEDEDAPVAVLLAQETGFAFDGSHIAVVQNIGTALNAEDEEVRSITFVQSGATETLKVSGDIKPANNVADLANGDIFFYAVDANNEIVKLEKIYNADDRTLPAADTYNIDDHDFAFVYGVITAAGDKITLASQVDDSTGALKAADGYSTKLAVNEVEGATYAWVEEASMDRKGCKQISITGVKETIRPNQVYTAVAVVNANKKIEDIVVIAVNADYADDSAINTALSAKFELNYED